MKDKINILIFPAQVLQACGPGAGCGCGPRPSSAYDQTAVDPNKRLRDIRYYLLEYFENKISIDFVNYSSKESILNSLSSLNTALLKSGWGFEITPHNFFIFVNSTSPLIIVEDKVAFSGRIPTTAEFIQYINENAININSEKNISETR